MRELTYVIGRFGAYLGMAAFGAGIALALLAGVDPLFAVARAGGLAAALVAFYALMCRGLMLWLGPDRAAQTAATGAASAATKTATGGPEITAAPGD